ncbi:MAG: phosphotransferase [Caldilineaceae bacterium]
MDQTRVLAKFDALQHYFQTLPTDPQVYGVVHGDCQANNLCLDDETFWMIDFDNCAYHWFFMDIATSLYYTLWERPAAQSNATFAAFVLENLWAGYAREYPLDVAWVERLPIFLKQIEMNSYLAILAYNQAVLGNDPAAMPPKHAPYSVVIVTISSRLYRISSPPITRGQGEWDQPSTSIASRKPKL